MPTKERPGDHDPQKTTNGGALLRRGLSYGAEALRMAPHYCEQEEQRELMTILEAKTRYCLLSLLAVLVAAAGFLVWAPSANAELACGYTTDEEICLDKQAKRDTVHVGQLLTFEITLYSRGSILSVAGDQVTDELPDELEFVRATVTNSPGSSLTPRCEYKPDDHDVFCDGLYYQQADSPAKITIEVTPTECGTFTNTARDYFDIESSDTVTVDCSALPVAQDDSLSTAEGTPVNVDVLANDTGSGLTITDVTDPANGQATQNSDGTIEYVPDENFNGQDSFEYTFEDFLGATDTATVSVRVLPQTEAAEITCGTRSDHNDSRVICEGTNNRDQIRERKGASKDDIRAKAGNDTINARRAGRDDDTVRAQPGDDKVFANDRDTRDKIDCGQGTDEAKIDVKRDTSGNITASDQVSSDCETVRDQDGNPVLLTALPETAVVDMADNPA